MAAGWEPGLWLSCPMGETRWVQLVGRGLCPLTPDVNPLCSPCPLRCHQAPRAPGQSKCGPHGVSGGCHLLHPPVCCRAADKDQSPRCFQGVYSTRARGTGLTAHPGPQPCLTDSAPLCLCCSQGSWSPAEGGGKTRMATHTLSPPCCGAEQGPSPAQQGLGAILGWMETPPQGKGDHTDHRWLLGQRPPIFQEFGEGLHVSGAPILDHLESRNRRKIRSDAQAQPPSPGAPRMPCTLPSCPAQQGNSAVWGNP